MIVELLVSVLVFKNDVSNYPLSLPIILWLEMIYLHPSTGAVLGIINGVYKDSLSTKFRRILSSYFILFISCLLQILLVSGENENFRMYLDISFKMSTISIFFQSTITSVFCFIKYLRKGNKDEKVRGTEI